MDGLSQLSGEPAAWHRRYLTFLSLGPSRTMVGIWRSEVPEGHRRRVLPGNWRRAARLYRWEDRAAAYDIAVARRTLLELEGHEKAMRLRDFDQINQIRDELAKKVASYREKPPSLRALLQLIRATNTIHRASERSVLGLTRFLQAEKEAQGLQATLRPPSGLPAAISQPREKRRK